MPCLFLIGASGLAAGGCASPPISGEVRPPRTAFAPRTYVCPRVDRAPVVDGRLDDAAWAAAAWTEDFADILGPGVGPPAHATRAKFLWTEHALYVAAELEEPHVWATITERDEVIYFDNDFEVFLDPDGDTHAYMELEVNAFGTPWDLVLTRPYRDGGEPITSWDIEGLRVGVHVDGTLNDPSDVDRGWTVELALPFAALAEHAGRRCPPRVDDVWRVNLTRVQWSIQEISERPLHPEGHAPTGEDNFVWSRHGVVNMHFPELWGRLQFADSAEDAPLPDPDLAVLWALRQVYYAQWRRQRTTGRYAHDLAALELPAGWPAAGSDPRMERTLDGYELSLRTDGGRRLHIRQDGRTW